MSITKTAYAGEPNLRSTIEIGSADSTTKLLIN